MAARDLFSDEQIKAIEDAIKTAETKTSGEIRVFIEERIGNYKEAVERAVTVFSQLNLSSTKDRNGTLFYLATLDRQFVILGDEGINQKVPSDFWEAIKEKMQSLFRNGQYADGMMEGISMAGDALINFFPYERNDQNELPDEVVFG